HALSAIPARASRLRAIVHYLIEHPPVEASVLLAACGGTTEALNKLHDRGFVERVTRADTPVLQSVAPAPGPALNEAQQEAVERIERSLGAFASHLLYGVTGSGKTEVYLRLIARVLARD